MTIIHIGGKPIDTGPPPPAIFETREDVRRWLAHPSNWFDSTLFILKWDGMVPTIQRERALELLRNPLDDGILDVVIWQRKIWREGGKDEDRYSPEPEPEPWGS